MAVVWVAGTGSLVISLLVKSVDKSIFVCRLFASRFFVCRVSVCRVSLWRVFVCRLFGMEGFIGVLGLGGLPRNRVTALLASKTFNRVTALLAS